MPTPARVRTPGPAASKTVKPNKGSDDSDKHNGKKGSEKGAEKGTEKEIDHQPKIKDVLKANGEEPDSTPAAEGDILKILTKLDTKLDTIQKDNQSIKTQLKALDSRVSDISISLRAEIEQNTEGLSKLKTTVSEIEDGVSFQGGQIDSHKKDMAEMLKKQNQFLTKIKEIEDRENKLKEEIGMLKERNLDMERHNRKYNLLFYGIPESRDENIYETVKTFLQEEAKIPKERVEQMIFANIHRIPKKGAGPKPIIVRFVQWTDRDLVLNQVFKGALPQNKNILTDLPTVLKEERYNLSKEAYKLRTGTVKYKTRILEKGTKLKLQIRKDHTQPWADYVV